MSTGVDKKDSNHEMQVQPEVSSGIISDNFSKSRENLSSFLKDIGTTYRYVFSGRMTRAGRARDRARRGKCSDAK